MNWFKGNKSIILIALVTLLVFTSMGLVKKDTISVDCRSITVSFVNHFDNYYLDDEDVLTLLTSHGTRKIIGTPLADLDFRALESELLNEKYIKEVQIFRDLVGNVTVEVSLRKPIARIVRKDGPDAYVDIDGEFLPTSDKFTSRVMLISGEYTKNLLEEGIKAENAPYFELIKTIYDHAFWKAQIAQLDIDKTGEIALYPQVTRQKVFFGHPEEIELKLKKLKIFYKEILPVKSWNNYKTVDLRFKDQIVCQ